jgi:hypothetical protein
LKNCHEYLIQHTLKSGGTKDHFRQLKVPGTALIESLYDMHIYVCRLEIQVLDNVAVLNQFLFSIIGSFHR